MPVDFNEIRQLLATIAQTDIAEVTLKSDDFELTVRKGVSVSNQTHSGGGVGSLIPSLAPSLSSANTVADQARAIEPAASSNAPPSPNQKFQEISSPMVGTFYRAPAPGETPFVEVGDRVKSGQTVCIIEAMKLMNEIETEISGQVMEILVQNGEPVEYGQPLMRINPD